MTLKKYLLGIALCALVIPMEASAAGKTSAGTIQPYAFLKGGLNLGYMHTDFGTNSKDEWWAGSIDGRMGVGLGVGPIRMEVEASAYSRMEGEDERYMNIGGYGWVNQERVRYLEMQTYMAAVYYDLNGVGKGQKFVPYFGGGIGLARTKTYTGVRRSSSKTAKNGDTKRDDDFAAMIAGGVGYKWKSWAMLDAGARYTLVTHRDILSVFSVDVGIRFLF